MNSVLIFSPRSFKIAVLIHLAISVSSCSNSNSDGNKLESLPKNPLAIISIDNSSFQYLSHFQDDDLPNIKDLKFLKNKIKYNLIGKAIASYHPIGASDLHWLISIPKESLESWHPSQLKMEKNLKRRSYSIGTLWQTSSIVIGETPGYILLSTSTILVEESIRQLEKTRIEEIDLKFLNRLVNKMETHDFITISNQNFSKFWPLHGGKPINDKFMDYRLVQNEILSWNFRKSEDSNSVILISENFDLSETIFKNIKNSNSISFPGWRWMVPSLNWAAWMQNNSEILYQDALFTSKAIGELCFSGRWGKPFKALTYFTQDKRIQTSNWVASDQFQITSINEKNLLPLFSYSKSVGDFLVSVDDTISFNKYASFLKAIRSKNQEEYYQNAINWLRTQPAEANCWWVSNTTNLKGIKSSPHWSGISMQIEDDLGRWCISSSIIK
jgi:hypothetical protein